MEFQSHPSDFLTHNLEGAATLKRGAEVLRATSRHPIGIGAEGKVAPKTDSHNTLAAGGPSVIQSIFNKAGPVVAAFTKKVY